MVSTLKELEVEIWKDTNLEQWRNVSLALKKESAKYYKVVYPEGRISSSSDLKRSSVEIYDPRMKIMARLPVFVEKGKELVGSLEFLSGLVQAPRSVKRVRKR